MQTRDATAKFGTICPTRGVEMPRITKSHMCVNWTLHPLGKLIVIGSIAIRLSSMLTPSMIKIDVVPVLAIALCVAIVIAFNTLCIGVPKTWLPAVAKEGT